MRISDWSSDVCSSDLPWSAQTPDNRCRARSTNPRANPVDRYRSRPPARRRPIEPAPPDAPKAWSCRTRPSAMPVREPASASPENPAVPVADNATGNDKKRVTGWLERLLHGQRPRQDGARAGEEVDSTGNIVGECVQ